MSLGHGSPWHWRFHRSHASVRCARCGLAIEHRASTSSCYGSAAPVGPIGMATMSGDVCSCMHPEPVVADDTA